MSLRTSQPQVRGIKFVKNNLLTAGLLTFSLIPAASVFVAPASVSAATVINAVDGRQYPYANAAWPNNEADPWGMYKRQCVSYVAWAVAASGRNMPNWSGKGNANQWPDNARAAGIPVDTNPRVGDVAIRASGSYGHAMYVEAVNANGTINVSQYNANWNGSLSAATVSASGLQFIHFP